MLNFAEMNYCYPFFSEIKFQLPLKLFAKFGSKKDVSVISKIQESLEK